MTMPVNILPLALPVFLALSLVEIIYLRKEHRNNESNKELFASLAIGLGGAVINFVFNVLVVVSYSYLYKLRICTIPVNAWWAWLLCFFADDFSYYWYHRLSHQIRFFWASHAVHHTPEVYSFTATFRVPWTAHITDVFLFWAWMPLIGFDPLMVIWFKSASVIYQFWLHTETIKRMPQWFEKFFNSPYYHRIHHASNTKYIDKNYAGTLIIWDKLFNTYIEETERPVYGLSKKLKSTNPVTIAFHEWKNLLQDFKKSSGIRDYFNYTFNVPGWSNDSSVKIDKG